MYKVFICDGKITLVTDPAEGNDLLYAFYLFYKDERERYFYTKNFTRAFMMPIREGSYRAIFFTKDVLGAITSCEKNFFIKDSKIIEIQERLLEETDKYKLTLYSQDADITFIVFNGTGSTKKTTPFGLNYLLGKGFNVIVCWQNNDQYQGLSAEQFQKIVAPVIENKHVILYGSSLGGYCSLYYAGVINATVIAAAPRNSAHPVVKKKFSKSMFENLEFTHKEICQNKITSKDVYMLIDPFQEEDIFFLEHFIKPAYPNIKIIEVPHAGHEVLFHLNKTKQLSGLLKGMIQGDNIQNLSDIDSEYTLFGKARYHFKQFEAYMDLVGNIENKSSLIDKKIDLLLSNFVLKASK